MGVFILINSSSISTFPFLNSGINVLIGSFTLILFFSRTIKLTNDVIGLVKECIR